MPDFIFKPSRDLTLSTIESDFVRFKNILNASNLRNQITVDLSEVEQCDSAGLALLVGIKKIAHNLSISCCIVEVKSSILALAELCGVKNLLQNNTLETQDTDEE